MRLGVWLSLFVVGAVAGSCNASSSFGCDDDDDCDDDGTCQWSNYCAFPDSECESGQRYGELAGEFSNLCVQPLPAQAGDAGTPSPTSDDGSGDTAAGGDETTGPGDDGPDSDETGPAGSCSCFALPPGAGWQGPILLQTGTSPEAVPACPSVAPSELFEGRTGLSVEAAGCEYQPADCSAVVEVYEPLGGCKGQPSETIELQTGLCFQTEEIESGVLEFDPQSCQCNAQEPLQTIPAPTWSGAGRLCGGSADECGEASTCLPEADGIAGEAICVYQPGDVDCPLAGYSHKILFFEGYDDTRMCQPCGQGEDPSCQVAIADDDCDGVLANLGEFGLGCGAFPESYPLFVYDSSSYECEGEFEPSGTVTPTNPTTACCLL